LKRLLGKVLALATGSSGWEALRDGVEIRRLAGSTESGPSVALLRYQPGARVPPHRHRGFEVILVISGSQSDENGTYEAGSLVINQPDDEHNVWSDDGCVVLIVWERPVEFLER